MTMQTSRRAFLSGLGLVIGVALAPRGFAADALERGDLAGAPGVPAFNAFVRVATDGTVTVLSKHIEFGQGPYTGLATLVAEELDADWAQVRAAAAPADDKIDHAKATKPRAGWVRGDMVATVEALEELNEVRRENARFRAQLDRSSVELNFPEIPTIDSSIDIVLFQNNRSLTGAALSSAKIRTTWAQAFPLVKRSLIWEMGYEGFSIEVEGSCIQVGSALAQEVSKCDIGTCFRISRGDLDRLIAYYIEAGLMAEEGHEMPFTDLAAKFARRLLLVESKEASFELVSGSVEIVQTSSSVDDEIPF